VNRTAYQSSHSPIDIENQYSPHFFLEKEEAPFTLSLATRCAKRLRGERVDAEPFMLRQAQHERFVVGHVFSIEMREAVRGSSYVGKQVG